MDYYLLQLQSIVGLFLFVYLFNLWLQNAFRNKNKEPPQASGGFPVIGHFLLLRGGRPLYQVLGDMADKHGPAFILRLGSRRTLVVSSWEVAKECFTINDKALSSRPENAAARHLGYNMAMFGFAPYGSYWRSLRKISTTELLSNARLDMLKHVMLGEIDTCLNELHTQCVCNDNYNSQVKVDMMKWFGDLNFNIVLQMVAGKRFFGSGSGSDEAWRFRNAVTKFFPLLFVSVPSDMFPWLEWMDLGGHVKAMKVVAKEMDSLMVSLLEEHREMRASGLAAGDRDFMDVMLSLIESDQFDQELDKDTVIKATSLLIILGGADTTTTSLTRALMNLLTNEDVMKKVQTELDEQVGKDRVVNESDMKKLVYLPAVIKESFRLTPTAELLVPRETMKDCVVAGFQVPAGTQVIVNAWKLQRDPKVWPEPSKFRPERFLASHAAGIDVKGQNYELIPFGTGRRSCAGISMALRVMNLTLARLIQGFDLSPVGDLTPETYGFGSGSTPFMVNVAPRISPEFYHTNRESML